MRSTWVILSLLMWGGLVLTAVGKERAPLHPSIPLLDRDGVNVLESLKPVSTMRTCGGCHDSQYVATHSYHVAAGSNERFAMGMSPGRRAWDYSPGAFGRWNPLLYRYLSPPGDAQLDLGVSEWIQTYGLRHVGGGPAVTGHGTLPLDQPVPPAAEGTGAGPTGVDPDRQRLEAATRAAQGWDWQASGVVEMNCFLCHLMQPDNEARIASLLSGQFQWAATATLDKTGVVRRSADGWQYVRESFLPDGTVVAATLGIGEPTSDNCGQCHGVAHFGGEPVTWSSSLQDWSTATKGQVFSPQSLRESAVNLQDKQALNRPWDVHAGAMLECTSCHFSLNDPKSYESTRRGRPSHLRYEPRRLSCGEFLRRPSHQFAKGQTAQGTVALHLSGTMRRCDDCHDATRAHDWLPYRDVHFARLSCEACHIPQVYAPALRAIDWTLITPQSEPRIEWRGVAGDPREASASVTGFLPVMLPQPDPDGAVRLVPHNLVTAWYWVTGGAQPRPVRLADLQAALLQGDRHHHELLPLLDAENNGRIEPSETRLDTPAKVAVVRQRLLAVGVKDPQIQGEIQPFGIHHGVGPSQGALRTCVACHSGKSRLVESMVLSSFAPGEAVPRPVGDAAVEWAGKLQVNARGSVSFRPETRESQLYVLGHDRWRWVNWLGMFALLGTLVGVAVHTGLRFRASRSSAAHAPATTGDSARSDRAGDDRRDARLPGKE